jgi:hypothetical protein
MLKIVQGIGSAMLLTGGTDALVTWEDVSTLETVVAIVTTLNINAFVVVSTSGAT